MEQGAGGGSRGHAAAHSGSWRKFSMSFVARLAMTRPAPPKPQMVRPDARPFLSAQGGTDDRGARGRGQNNARECHQALASPLPSFLPGALRGRGSMPWYHHARSVCAESCDRESSVAWKSFPQQTVIGVIL